MSVLQPCQRPKGPAYAAVAAVVLLNSTTQVLLKAAAAQGPQSGLLGNLLNPFFAGAVCCLGLSFLAWSYALGRIPLSRAHPVCSLTYVLTPIAAARFFGEQVTGLYFAGIACVCAGIYLTSTSKVARP